MTTSNAHDAEPIPGSGPDTGRAQHEEDPAASGAAVDPEVRAELTRLRDSIDNIDAAVVHMLAERFKCTQRVGHLKAAHRLPPADPARESQQITRLRALAEDAKLDPAFAEKLLNFIIAEVIRHHERIADTAQPQQDGR
ncbi:chorismate mutase [Streptomyces odontomachi]|uniref:chorismate mutase n=1 Tax=Streptomyces odontomachi TaxID=2944940 RepID=UPI00210D1C93|nr:chorismate mutase [Streptomyces sp. ODS25]